MKRSSTGTLGGLGSKRRRRENLSSADILAWPTSASPDVHIQSGGWVLGWRTAPCSSMPLETVIVAGILSSVHGEMEALLSEYSALSARIVSIQGNTCFCCTCCDQKYIPSKTESTGSSSDCCSCSRRLLFSDLCIVAFVAKRDENTLNLPVPVIELSKVSGQPLPSRGDGLTWRQLVLFENKHYCGSDGLFQMAYASPKSSFSKQLVTRLSHAKTVLGVVEGWELLSKEISQKSEALPNYALDDNARDLESSTMMGGDGRSLGFLPLIYAACAFLRSRSLFVQHILSTSPSPLWSLSRLLQRGNGIKRSPNHVVCLTCKRLRVPTETNHEKVARLVSTFDHSSLAFVDLGLGFLLGLAVLSWSGIVLKVVSVALERHYGMLLRAMDWLEKFPIGFKLNVRLTETMGKEIRSVILFHGWLWERFGPCTQTGGKHCTSSVVVIVALVFGASGLSALLYDLLRLSMLHVSFLAFCFRKVYSTELYFLRALWRLFRGKKRNVLRQRTDTMKYDSTQLLLGTILFAMTLFMMTTVLVYHGFFAFLDLSILALTACVALTYGMLRRFSLGKIWLRMTRPNWFVERVYLEDLLVKEADGKERYNSPDETRLHLVFTSPPSIVSDVLGPHSRALVLWLYANLRQSMLGGIVSQELQIDCFMTPRSLHAARHCFGVGIDSEENRPPNE